MHLGPRRLRESGRKKAAAKAAKWRREIVMLDGSIGEKDGGEVGVRGAGATGRMEGDAVIRGGKREGANRWLGTA
jgi:hypothetical protein